MSTFNEMIEKDLELMWLIQDYCQQTPWLSDKLTMITNKNPMKDVVIIVWLFFIIGVFELGQRHFWVVVTNLIFSFGVRKLVEAKRPVEYDIRLQPSTDLNAESFGFPSLESYMSVVIMGHLCISLHSVLFPILAVVVIFVVGFSRVFSRCRFPHQVVGSWICGIAGLVLGMHCCEKMNFHKMTHHEHGVCVGLVALGVLCNFALCMENNDSRLVGIPKQEFIRVMSDIISGPAASSSSNQPPGAAGRDMLLERSRGDGAGEEDDYQQYQQQSGGSLPEVMESPRSLATKQAQASSAMLYRRRQKQQNVKSDSLFFLQRGMEAREAKLKTIIQQNYNGNPNPELSARNYSSHRFNKEDSVSSGDDIRGKVYQKT